MGVAHPGHTVSVLLRSSNKLILEEADRSIHDALCVSRCLVKERFVIEKNLIFLMINSL
jgi:T-complex protein 1 subunit delta